MITHKTQGRGISGTIRYVMGEGKRDPATKEVPKLAPGESSRVAWFGGTGFGFPIDSEQRLDIARRLMEWAAQNQSSKTKKCVEDCLHLSLSWDIDENPTRAEMEAAAHSVLAKLGMANARAIFAAHNDTEHRHLHLVISRIDPASGKAFSNSFDTEILSDWALQWELEHGGVRCKARLEKADLDAGNVIEALIARRETFTPFELNRQLSRAIPARAARHAYVGEVLARPDIIKLIDPANGQVMRYTTRQTLHAEHLAEAAAGRLYADASFRVSEAALRAVLDRSTQEGRALRDDQVDVLRHATDAEGLAIIIGKAGSGKSFAMASIASAYETEGYAVQALAPTNKVASALKRDGLDARTIHSALGSLDRGKTEWNARTVIMVDEAGMISTRLLARLLSHAEHAGAKVILLGDEKQLASMGRGGMFGYLAALHGAGELSQITRQHSAEQRHLAVRASQYDFEAALNALAGQGGVVAVERPEDRIAKAAELWGAGRARTPDRSLFVVTASNADAEAANRAMRTIRRARGELGLDHILATADGPQDFAQGDRILFSGSAASREGREAGLVNGNAGEITKIEGSRVSVALDGANAGEIVTFTVGKNREPGEFDAIRHGLAGTIYKAQGATYDEVLVIDSPAMRANAGYVALTRHRDSVSIVTSRVMRPDVGSWMEGEGGLAGLSPAQRASAERSFDKWRVEANPAAGKRYGLADYVAYVQAREAENRAEGQEQAQPLADMAKRWSRIEDRRAASRFEAQDYQPPESRRLTPAEVRAAVGVEKFEQDRQQHTPAQGDALATKGEPAVAGRNASRDEDMTMEPVIPSEEALRNQADIEAARLRELQEQEERAQAFRRARQIEADDAQKNQTVYRRQVETQDEDISSATARYAIALGENYNIRDPYASLARSAMSEYAMFHRNQEKLRDELAKERDPDKKRVIELRRNIEACDYMALTSERLAGISVAIVGRNDAPLAVIDRERAANYRVQATALRAERIALTEAIQDRVTVTAADRKNSVQSMGARSDLKTPEPSQPAQGRPVAVDVVTGANTADRAVTASAGCPSPIAEAADVAPSASRQDLTPEMRSRDSREPSALNSDVAAKNASPPTEVTVTPSLTRADVIAGPASIHVTLAKGSPDTPPEAESVPPAPAERQQLELPWMEALRQRVEEATASPGDTPSERAMARLAKKLQQGIAPTEAANDQVRDEGPEPDM
jgi:hypothetical protein